MSGQQLDKPRKDSPGKKSAASQRRRSRAPGENVPSSRRQEIATLKENVQRAGHLSNAPPFPPTKPDEIIGQSSLEKQRYAARAEVDNTNPTGKENNQDSMSADIERLQETITLLQQRLDLKANELKEHQQRTNQELKAQSDQVDHWKSEVQRWQKKEQTARNVGSASADSGDVPSASPGYNQPVIDKEDASWCPTSMPKLTKKFMDRLSQAERDAACWQQEVQRLEKQVGKEEDSLKRAEAQVATLTEKLSETSSLLLELAHARKISVRV